MPLFIPGACAARNLDCVWVRGCHAAARAHSGEVGSAQAANSVCSLPPCGGGLGRGVAQFGNAGASISRPPPPTPPHKGEGSTPSVRHIYGSNTTEPALESGVRVRRIVDEGPVSSDIADVDVRREGGAGRLPDRE